MAEFTVITHRRVLRVKARSIQHLLRSMQAVGMKWQGVHEDKPAHERGGRR